MKPILPIFLLLFLTASLYSFPFKLKWFDEAFRLDITDTFVTEYHGDNRDAFRKDLQKNDFYTDIRNKLNVDLRIGDYLFGARLDLCFFIHPPSELYKNDYNLEKIYFVITKKNIEFTVGDYYVSFGRGMALSLRKVDELGIDTTLRGGEAKIFTKYIRGTMVAGFTNALNVDNIFERRIDDPNDFITGLRLEADILKYLTVGAHGVLLYNREAFPPVDPSKYTSIIGGSLFLPPILKYLTLYSEFNILRHSTLNIYSQNNMVQYDSQLDDGYIVYNNLNLYFGSLSFLFEQKYTKNYYLRNTKRTYDKYVPVIINYNEPPTLEKDDQEAEDLGNVKGVRGRMEYQIRKSQTSFFINALYFYNTPEDKEYVLHFYGGFEQRFSLKTVFNMVGGWRREVYYAIAGPGENGYDHLIRWHLEFNLYWNLIGIHTLQIYFRHRSNYRDAGMPQENDYIEEDLAITYYIGNRILLSFLYGYSNEFGPELRNNYFAGQVEYKFTPSSSIRVFGGTNRGGVKCVSGLCRFFPPFEGVRLEGILRI